MLLRFLLLFIKIFLALSLAGLIGLGLIIYHYTRDLPDYSQLKKYHPPSVTRLYSSDGKLIEEFAREHRIFIAINSIPKHLKEAFIAVEDKNFYSHEGIDLFSIIRAAITNISHVLNNRRVEGGSTITQQVVKNFLLTSERSLDRKIKEAILSYMISQVFTKDEILELYLNQIYLGKGSYGVASAALNYFNKSIEDLTIAECALLASMPKAPSKYDPQKNFQRALERRNYVISRLYEEDYITKEQAKEALADPIKLAEFDKVETLDADYYASKVREEIIEMFGEEYFYTAGLTVITCADSKIQDAAREALRYGIRKYDYKRGYRGPLGNISLTNWDNNLKSFTKPAGILDYELAVILNIETSKAKIGFKNKSIAYIDLKSSSWAATNLTDLKKIFSLGDVILVEKIGENYNLRQIPEVNGGIMVIENETGRVLAAEGGYDYSVSKFDRTTQANRQPGSLIKPFVYMAAIENGAKLDDIFMDEPIDVYQGPGLPIWSPKNYEENFLGPVTLRKGLEKSRNTVTVRVGQYAGLKKIVETIKRFGINDSPPMINSMVLGALETTLSKMTLAYGIIANGGKKIEPQYIELIKDRKGNVIYKRDYTECTNCKNFKIDENGEAVLPDISHPERLLVTDDATGYQMQSLMMGVVQRGTAQGAKYLKKIIGGKTGTTNNAKDAWFIGFTPKIVVGTYIGYDNPKTLGKKVSGATIALPIFTYFMENAYKDEPSVDFIVPTSIRLMNVDYDTGKPSSEKGSILEAFKVNNFNPSFDSNSVRENDNSFDPFNKIQDKDVSEELY